jgi:hypothetical protein
MREYITDEMIPSDPLMALAWRDCLMWAITNEPIMAAFRKETGNSWEPGMALIERMIDSATGVDAGFAKEFILWFNANVWGPLDLVAVPGEEVSP